MQKMYSKFLSILLTVCMIGSMLPTVAFADDGIQDSGMPLGFSKIIAFADLAEEVAVQQVAIGTPLEELTLPNTLSVTVIKVPEATETVSKSDATTDSSAQNPETQPEETTVDVSDWVASPSYDGETVGDYLFTASLALTEGLSVADGVTAPQITVTVAELATPVPNEDTAFLAKTPSPEATGATGLQSVEVGAFTLSTDNVEGLIESTDYTYADGVLSLNTNKEVTIANTDANTTTSDRIVMPYDTSKNYAITLDGVNIETSSDLLAIHIDWSGTVTLADGSNNRLVGRAGLQANFGDVILTGTGNLTAISNGDLGGISEQSGTLSITGGTIVANGYPGTGEGGSVGSPGIQGDSISISGSAHITATGGATSAGIGSRVGNGSFHPDVEIAISGNPTIIATGGSFSAGIGGSFSSGDTTINISGGSISAVGGKEATGIGGGYKTTTQTVSIAITGGEFAQGHTAAQTVCGAEVSGNYHVADNSGNTDYPYLVQAATDMLVVPSAVTVQKGQSQQFTAKGTAEAVTWSVTGGVAGTAINNSGLLTVAEGETASTLTVTATANGSSANATVTVIEPYVTVSFDNGYGSGSAAPVKVTQTGNAFTYTLPRVGSGAGEIDFTAPTGETFAGWLVGDETTATAAGQEITLIGDVTLTANWVAVPVLYLGGIAIDADSTTEISGTGYCYRYDTDTATGTLTLTGYSSPTNYTNDYDAALFANFNLAVVLNGENTLAGYANDDFSISIFIEDANLTISGTGSLAASGGESVDSYGICANSISITGGSVTAIATHQATGTLYHCTPIQTEQGSLSVTGNGSLIMKKYTSNGLDLLSLNRDLTVGTHTIKVGYHPDGTDAYEIRANDLKTYQHLFNYAEIKPGVPTADTNIFYPIWVGGVQVTMKNAAAIQQGVSFNSSTRTLTLNNATITAPNSNGTVLTSEICDSGIYFWGNLTISLANDDSAITGGSGNAYSYGIYGATNDKNFKPNLTITGQNNVTLAVSGSQASVESHGIKSEGTFTLSSGNVTAKGGNVANAGNVIAVSRGVSASGSITHTGGNLTAIGGTATAPSGTAYSEGINQMPTGGTILVSDAADTGDLKVMESGKLISAYAYVTVFEPLSISGTVKGSDTGDNGLAWATVQLKSNRGNVGTSVYTDSNGAYTISNAPAGSYTVQVSKSGYTDGTIPSFVLSTSNITDKDITLQKGTSGVTVTTQPQNASVELGEDATFRIVAENAASYQWYCTADVNGIPHSNGMIANTPDKVSGATTATLTLYNVTNQMDGATFWCLVKGSDPTDSAFSNQVTLTATPIPPTITSVEVTPVAANVQKGTTQQFNAAISGKGAFDNTVTWTVEGTSNAGTTISDTGLLSVASDETATALTIKATSVGDNIKYDTATVSVTDTPVTTHTLTVVSGTGGGNYEAGAAINITANEPATGKQFKNWTTTGGGSFTDVNSASTTFTMPANTVTVKANYEDIPTSTHSVMVVGSYASVTGAGNYTKDATVTIDAGNRSNYSFNGWTVVSGGVIITNINSKNTSFTMPDNSVTVKANWRYNGGGSSGGSGGSGTSTPTVTTPPATTENPKPATEVTTTVKPTVSNGTVAATVSAATVNDAIAKAQAEAKKKGITENGIVVEIQVDTKNTTANNLSANLSKASVEALVKADAKEVRITSEIASINLNLETLKEIQKQVGSDVNVTAKKVDKNTLSANAKKLVGNRPVYDFSITGANGKKVADFGKGKVSVSIPYTLGANEHPANVVAYYIDSTGKVTEMPNSVYDPITKTLGFVTDHFSMFAVGYKAVSMKFTDIANHWGKENIQFVVSRGLFSGTSNTTFSPNSAMTRGMFVTALGRLAEADVSKYTKSSFSDVTAGAYYMGYVEWATKNGIVKGIGNGKFAPDQSITREQMAVIMVNYAKEIGFTLPEVHAETTFADNAKISSYAKDVVKAMQMAGVISGKDGNKFDPQGTATRAEVSAVLKRFVELVISTDSAQGWMMNDSGKWMYYENGKPVTGKKTIDDSTYTFDQYGVTADVPKNRKYSTYTVQKGDSFWLIAYKQGCTMKELEMLNNKSRFSLIHPGDELIVPEK